jgi:threonine/homoserine/homoserine lactone efflux protein
MSVQELQFSVQKWRRVPLTPALSPEGRMSFLGLFAQTTDPDGPHVSWGWLWGCLTAILTAVIIAGFRLVWRGAMADFERRLDNLETELAYSQRRYHEIERADGGGRRRRPVVDNGRTS